MRGLLVASLLVTIGCTDRALLRNTSAAYFYQKAMYQAKCLPMTVPRTEPCIARDVELTWDEKVIAGSLDAVTKSQGGKLPTAATDALKIIRKDLDAAVPLP